MNVEWIDLLKLLIIVVGGEFFTGVKKWTNGKTSLVMTILNGICGKLARVIPTMSDLK